MSDELFSFFDAWELLFKARKAKGLDKWERLRSLSEKLQGKDVRAISFTCSHPSHAGEPVRHLLGSVEGNLHFLLGYGNPRFHLAAYHWQIIDPNITESEAEEIFSRMQHPSNPTLWSRVKFDVGDEGDIEEGEAHPTVKQAKAKNVADQQRQAESIKAKSPIGSYTCVPSEGLVYGDHNGHVYRWDLVKDSFFSAFNPDVADAMNAAAIKKSKESVRYFRSSPSAVRERARLFRGLEFDETVFPLIKSRGPRPGSVMCLNTDHAESVYCLVTPTTLEFYGRDGNPVEVKVFDRVYKSFDLVPYGNVPPAVLLSFIVKNFKVNTSLLSEAMQGVKKSSFTPDVEPEPSTVEGVPTIGFDNVPAVYVEGLGKSVIQDSDGVFRVVVETL